MVSCSQRPFRRQLLNQEARSALLYCHRMNKLHKLQHLGSPPDVALDTVKYGGMWSVLSQEHGFSLGWQHD